MPLLSRSLPFCVAIMCASLPALAGQSAAVPTTPAPASSASQTPAADQQTYTRRAEGEMEEWGTKLHALHERTKASGDAAGRATEGKLQEAWEKVKEQRMDWKTPASRDGTVQNIRMGLPPVIWTKPGRVRNTICKNTAVPAGRVSPPPAYRRGFA